MTLMVVVLLSLSLMVVVAGVVTVMVVVVVLVAVIVVVVVVVALKVVVPLKEALVIVAVVNLAVVVVAKVSPFLFGIEYPPHRILLSALQVWFRPDFRRPWLSLFRPPKRLESPPDILIYINLSSESAPALLRNRRRDIVSPASSRNHLASAVEKSPR